MKDFGELPYFSIITMICDDFKISGDVTPGTVICDSLISMEKAMRHVSKDKPVVIDDDKKQEIFDFIQKNQYVGKDARLVHKQTVAEFKEKLENNDKICPYCKVELVLRNGKNGEFYGCKNFPKCKYTRGV